MSVAEKFELKLPACDFVPEAYRGPSREEVLKTRKQYLNPGIFHIYKEPLMIVNGHMQYLFDETGRRYLDLLGGIVTISCGHCHPKVIARTIDQIKKIQHTTTIYLHPNIGEFAEKLASKLPDGLDSVYFVNSGSEANDLAIMMSRLYTGHWDVLALENAYHGGVASALGLTSHHTWKFPVPHGDGVHHVTNPDPYFNRDAKDLDQAAQQGVSSIVRAIRYRTPGKVAAFIAEPFQGVGGVTSGSPRYWQEAYAAVREHGGLCIADEVQAGFGRTGDHYWGFENFGVVPDIVTMAKGIGNGVPLAAVVTRREIAQVLTQRIHFNTFGGNPVSMAQGSAVLDVIDEENLQKNCKVIGTQLIEGLKKLQKKHPMIGDIRGKGLMLGVEMVRNADTREPATQQTLQLLEELRKMSILIGKGGLFGNVLRLKPPMCITKADADYALEAIDCGLSTVKNS